MHISFIMAISPAFRGNKNAARLRPVGPRDSLLLGLTLLTLVYCRDARASEAPTTLNGTPVPSAAMPLNGAPVTPSAIPVAATPFMTSWVASPIPEAFRGTPLMAPVYSRQDFRPRGKSLSARDSNFADVTGSSLMANTTTWQRLGDFRSHNQVRVMTLWETDGSSFALLAGTKGDPSLQWTSRSMNRGGATRGLLDGIVKTSLNGLGRNMHLSPRGTGNETAGKPGEPGTGNLMGTR